MISLKGKIVNFDETFNGEIIFNKKIDKIIRSKSIQNEDYIIHGTVSSQLGIDENTFNNFLTWNARLHLGLQIKESIETKGQCYFEAEL